jgi:hypothetical protein
MTNNISKSNCIEDMSASIKRSAAWRRNLQAKYPDPKNGRAADKLDRLASDLKEMNNEDWLALKPFYKWSSGKWSEAVSETSRCVGYRGVETVSEFVSHLAGILSQNEIAA